MLEHAVIIQFHYGSTDLQRLFDLEDELEKAIKADDAGEFDGNEVAVDGSDGSLYMYGPNADNLFAAIRPVLMATSAIKNAIATLRYGPPQDGVRELKVKIAA